MNGIDIEITGEQLGGIRVLDDGRDVSCWIPIEYDALFRSARPGDTLEYETFVQDPHGPPGMVAVSRLPGEVEVVRIPVASYVKSSRHVVIQ